MSKPVILIVTGIFAVIIALGFLLDAFPFSERSKRSTNSYTIVQTWELPQVLAEVSDISWAGENKVAAVQDENGIVFMYNLKSNEIVHKIEFGGSGDYEGLAVEGKTIYVMRSDGKIFEIQNYNQENFTVNSYKTPLTEKDMEGLAFHKKHNSLLLATKEGNNNDYKVIYEFNLQSKKLKEEPIYKIRFDDPIFKDIEAEKKEETIKPSEIAFHPSTGQLFVLDASIPMLVVFDANGDSQNIYFLDQAEFAQPEGLTFDETGNLYISNEGEPGNILRVALKK